MRTTLPDGIRSLMTAEEALHADEVLRAHGTRLAAFMELVAGTMVQGLTGKRQRAVVVCVYYRGEEVLYLGGGVVKHCGSAHVRPRPVERTDLFAGFSVSKGLAAATLLAALDETGVAWDAPAATYWPACGPGVSIGDLASHRGRCQQLLACLGAILIWGFFGWWPRLFRWMTAYLAWRARSVKEKVKTASYHQISFSFFMVALIEAVAGTPFRDAVAARLTNKLALPGEMFLGEVPPAIDARVVRVEAPPCGAGKLERTRRTSAASTQSDGSWARWVLHTLVAPLEGRVIVWFCNRPQWRRILLPSSNGVFTARAVARVYGCLANHGGVRVVGNDGVARPVRLASENAVDDLARCISSPCHDVAGDHPDAGWRPRDHAEPARLSRGWFPWASAELHGAEAARTVLNAEGMGGSASWADPTTGLAVCVLKSVYEPLAALSGSISPDTVRIAEAVRAGLGLG